MTETSERFWSRATPEPNSGCWLWTGEHDRAGYGRRRRKGGSTLVHRQAFEMVHGPIPAGLSICHRCDVRCCVNPDHLYAGTHAENMADRERRGRGKMPVGRLRGETHPCAKLTEHAVHEIRERLSRGESERLVAKVFGVGRGAISAIKRGHSWKSVRAT